MFIMSVSFITFTLCIQPITVLWHCAVGEQKDNQSNCTVNVCTLRMNYICVLCSSLIGSDEPSNSTSATMPEEKNKPIIYSTVIPATRPEEKPKVFDVRVNYETVDHLKTEEVRHVLQLCHI